MPARRALIALVSALALGGCYESNPTGVLGAGGFPSPTDAADAPASQVLDGSAATEDLADLDPDAALAEVAVVTGVPADLLRSIAFVESGFATLDSPRGAGWLALRDGDVALAAQLTGLTPSALRDDRDAGLIGGAAVLAHLRADVAPSAHPEELDAAWWPVLEAWASTGDAWLDDEYAAEVFGVLQRGLIAPTEDEEAELVAVRPQVVPGIGEPGLAPPPPHVPGQAPTAVRFLAAPDVGVRGGAIERIVLHSAEGSWARTASDLLAGEGSAHYLIRATDGQVTQMVRDADAARHTPGADDDTLAVMHAGSSMSPATWTVQSIEASARLVGWLAAEHGIPLDRDHVVAADELSAMAYGPGPHFPWEPYLQMADCFATGGAGCANGLAGAPGAEGWPADAASEDTARAEDPEDTARSEGRDGAVASVPYFYQYSNSLHPSASCQNTSIAMVLKWLGWSGTPDTITSRFGKNLAQSPAGLAQVFNTLAEEAGLSARLTPRTNGTLDGLNALLDEGKPVIVHGYMTSYGHVVVATGRAGSDYVVNDPAGRWAERWKGGYPYGWNSSVGRSIRYARAPFEAAIATSNGSSYLPLWYHELTGVDGAGPTEEPPAETPPGGTEPAPESAPGSEPEESTSYYDWADISWVSPQDGDTVPNPTLLEAERHGGWRVEFWADAWRIGGVSGNPATATATFETTGTRSLTAKNLSFWGTVLAETTISVEVGGDSSGPVRGECAVMGTISCGQTVSGDTSSSAASDIINGYPDIVGNWSGPEMAWTWTASGGGPVKIQLIDPRPSELNHDIMVLKQESGVCVAPDWVDIGWNSLEFEPDAGATYTFVVDGHDGEAGPFQMELDCSP